MSQELSIISKIPQMNEAAFTNILDMFREGKIRVKPHTQVLESLGSRGLPKMSIRKHAFNLSLCFLKPKSMNSVLSGLSLSLLADIHSLTS